MAFLDVKRTADLDRNEVRKNIFGILSLFLFLATTLLWFIIGPIAQALHPGTEIAYYIAVAGYILAVMSEVISIFMMSKNKNINPETSGSYHGFTSLFLSILMLLYIVVYKL